jgi:UDP-N-acetyl-alpha-D-muramoyl-L-alanyl-L-glutamate epimerase
VSTLVLREIRRGRNYVAATCALEDLTFTFTVWYEDVDLAELADRYGIELMDRIAFHIAMFQINAVCSLHPEYVDLGLYARFATSRFMALWREVFDRVWAQWRWQHQLPDYHGPLFLQTPAAPAEAVAVASGPVELLAFNGGGKDSLAAMKLLERASLPFATLGYSHSIYGAAATQHALIDQLGAASARVSAERIWMFDDFLDSPVAALRPELQVVSLIAAETPASMFAALPIVLARGYRGLAMAHEASANASNLIWGGERVNHQWGKGWEAEVLLDDYLRTELLTNVRYFSVLQPVHDEVIFELIARDSQLVPLTHSCNVRKPWCGRCAKCAYVWLQMAAHLPASVVAATIGESLGERTENERWFRELFGLTEHTPFECVGSAPEARLALALLPRPLGAQMATLACEVGALDVRELARPLLSVGKRHGMPVHVAAGVLPQLDAAASAARRRLGVTEE